ncbi:Cyclic pyranopterin monophosphate synthase [Candidatus Propionivibrio aalborgensis]|uniref:GTP 3',8-cyclase n=1 Tax=Candidatus Propionivibrio aalborgensis TaxID=1860101 RepID=A0A1A8Y1S4_9RHOO|nr:GTP 3',8-cyclase MoaA [Candidatus Propionivibrio aalborgensis]SBT11075.1 Cyclic pyranopterin monophosphate synthase [Candidatus Propionivibrio aalborgensis]
MNNLSTPPLLVADTLQRPLRDLRISVTDRCNLRCTYCMPREVFGKDFVFLPRAELLSFEEIERVAGVFVQLGVQKIRLSGGEPLMRHGVEHLIEALSKLCSTEGQPVEIALTTNGLLLSRKAQALKNAGLSRLTVSLDGLSEAVFQRMSDSTASVTTVLGGIEAAQRVGFSPIKVNMVVKRGENEHEIIPLVRRFRNTGIVLRFIEYMDVGTTNGWRMNDVVTAQEILALINNHYPIRQLDPNYRGEVAKRWMFADGGGEIGVIASVTQAFCHDCSRIRLSTDGKLYTCLFASHGVDLRDSLRRSESDAMLARFIIDTWQHRTDRYSQMRHEATTFQGRKIEMSYIGG